MGGNRNLHNCALAPTMRWKVRIDGDEQGLEDLSKSFNDDSEIFEEDDVYFLWSSDFSDLDDAHDVNEVAQNIVRTVRNFGKRDSLWVEELESGTIHEINNDGTEHVTVIAEAEVVTVRSRATVATVSGESGEETYQPADRTYEWTRLALEDEKVAELVELLDRGDNWVNLYRIYEFIQDNIDGDDNIVARGWWSQSEKDLFKQTANSRNAIGDDARHARENYTAPENPMTQAEAKRMIETLIDHWLRHRSS